MGVLTIFDMLGQNAQCMLSLTWANLHDSFDDGLAERHVWVVLKTVTKEFEQSLGFRWNTKVKLAHRLNRLDFEFDSKIWQVCTDLLEQLLHLFLIARLEEG